MGGDCPEKQRKVTAINIIRIPIPGYIIQIPVFYADIHYIGHYGNIHLKDNFADNAKRWKYRIYPVLFAKGSSFLIIVHFLLSSGF